MSVSLQSDWKTGVNNRKFDLANYPALITLMPRSWNSRIIYTISLFKYIQTALSHKRSFNSVMNCTGYTHNSLEHHNLVGKVRIQLVKLESEVEHKAEWANDAVYNLVLLVDQTVEIPASSPKKPKVRCLNKQSSGHFEGECLGTAFPLLLGQHNRPLLQMRRQEGRAFPLLAIYQMTTGNMFSWQTRTCTLC